MAEPVLTQLNAGNTISNQSQTSTATANHQQHLRITKQHFEQFLSRHPEVLQMMIQEMTQASSTASALPITQVANNRHSQINRTPAVAERTPGISTQKAVGRYNSAASRHLMATPKNALPSSPYGIGEMQQAARTSLDTLEKNIVLIAEGEKEPSMQLAQVRAASMQYQGTERRYPKSSKVLEANQRPVRQSSRTVDNFTRALNMANELGAEELSVFTEARKKEQLLAKAAAKNSPTNLAIVDEIMPYAKQYAERLGYRADDASTEQILKDTVNFYSRSNTLADTLKSLVKSL